MKVAVIGSGVAGLAATWMLNEHSEHEVHLFEADSRPGGHTNTVDYGKPGDLKGTESTKVDTGFIVFNTVTYPNLLRFLKLKNVDIIASDMSFSVTRDRGLYEWSGTSLSSLFAQRKNLLNPGQWRMIWDIIRFNHGALLHLERGDCGESIGSLLKREGYSDAFRDNYLLPMTAAIWSTPPDSAALDFPAFTLLRFMHNHHLLQILDRPTWLTVKNGSHSYVNNILEALPFDQFYLSTSIDKVGSSPNGGGKIQIESKLGEIWDFDHVIMACHADTSLSMLKKGAGLTGQENSVLSGFQFSKNRAVLHSDAELMPKRRETWSAWNYLTASDGSKANVNSVALTYWMNLLQSIPENEYGPVLVTLNPPYEPAKHLIRGEWSYDHPLFSELTVKSQGRLRSIQNQRNITYCGAWTGYGFHEDGFSSGMRIAEQYLDADSPFNIAHAERNLSPTRTDKILQSIINILEHIRRFLEIPWRWYAYYVVLLFLLLEGSLVTAQKTLRRNTKGQIGKHAVSHIHNAETEMRSIRKFWEKT